VRRSASEPSRVVLLRLLPEALCRRTPEACQTSGGISLRHPAEDNRCQLGTQHQWRTEMILTPRATCRSD
jgi:hypothetical protein